MRKLKSNNKCDLCNNKECVGGKLYEPTNIYFDKETYMEVCNNFIMTHSSSKAEPILYEKPITLNG